MHQALYRKWRPQRFDDVYGQDHITSILKYELENSKFSHAYLFCGSRGTGKTTCAKILAKAVNCLDLKNGSPCGVCEACRSIDSGAATDVLEMDAASNNGVDNIRDIRDEVMYSPSKLKYRVYIIDEVHMLSASAFNALLKTLEEPPEHVVFVLATTELHKLPATIISRCQRFDFRRISTAVLKEHLMRIAASEGIEIDEDAAIALAKHAQGGMRDAISLLDLCAGGHRRIDLALVEETVGSSGRGTLTDIVRAIVKKDYETIFSFIDSIVQSSKDITIFWQDLISLYRDILVTKTSKNAAAYLDLTDSETESLAELASMFTTERLSYHCDMMREAYLAMMNANSVRRIVAELTLVRMCDERLSTSPEAMLSRISALESAAPSGATNQRANQARSECADPATKTEKTVAAKKRQAPTLDDDDMFRGDAPVAIPKKEAKPMTAPESNTQNKLHPFKQRAEVTEIMDGLSAMMSSFFKNGKWYVDDAGHVIVRFTEESIIQRIKSFKGEQMFASAVSQVTGRTVTPADIALECKSESEMHDVIDDIIGSAEN
ncbi:MAG: DNA polymerase III subunit gamma/tau [Ruminococcaceae bacterium]|nr:DNA polymerase III subunit gamma/tau [Oscillospiraceae bacterium]